MTINVKTAIMIMTTTMIMIIIKIIMMNLMMIGKESCEARRENHQRRNTQNNLLGPLTQAPRPPPRLPSVWPTKFPKKHFVLIFHDNSDVDDDDGIDYVRMKMFLQ